MRNAPVGVQAPRTGWVVYVFSPQSPVSEENSGRAQAVAESLPSDWAFLAVAMEEGLPAFLERVKMTAPVISQVPSETLAAYRVTTIPRTYILDRNWKLLEVLDGAFQGEVADRLASRLKVKITRSSDSGPTAQQDQNRPGSMCLDNEQRPYSRGSKADVLGLTFRCGPGGIWAPAA